MVSSATGFCPLPVGKVVSLYVSEHCGGHVECHVECHCVVSSAIELCLLTRVVSRASVLCYAACAPGIAASNERV